jgi:transcriptional regulator
MYLRPVHTDLHLPTIYKFIRDNPLGILTTAIQSPNYPLLQSSHIPWVLDVPDEEPPAGASVGTLRGHLARANPQTKALIEAIAKSQSITDVSNTGNGTLVEEVMILFNGPVHHYVTPKFYTETKPSTGKVVPTWDYSAVQAYGTAKIYFDTSSPETGAFLSKQINDLSRQSEEGIMGYTGQNGKPSAWTVDQAPEKYTALLKKAIIGIEIELSSLAGKFKMSQELTDGDREGTINGFQALRTAEGDEMAKTVSERAELLKEAKK